MDSTLGSQGSRARRVGRIVTLACTVARDFSVRLPAYARFTLATETQSHSPLADPVRPPIVTAPLSLALFRGPFRPLSSSPREGPVPLFLASVRTVKRARCSAPTVAGRSDGSMVHRLVERPSPDPPTRPYRSPTSVSFSVLTGFMPINTCRVRNAVSFRYILTPRLVTGAGAPTFQTADASRRCLDNRWTRAALADAGPLRRAPHRTRNLDREIQDRSDGFRR